MLEVESNFFEILDLLFQDVDHDLNMTTIAIRSTIMPARAMIAESIIGFGRTVPTKLARGNNNGMPAATINPIPKIIPI